MSGKIHSPADLAAGKEPGMHTDRRLGGVQDWSGCFRVEKNNLSLPEIKVRFLGCTARHLFTIQDEIYRLI